MAIFKCKMCGGDLNVEADSKIIECEYCGTTQTVPVLDSEKKVNLFNRANRLRLNSEFDKAAGIYENIIAEFPEEAEAYWGLCLCNYGIEYVDDPVTAKKIPTCHRASFEKLSSDENFNMAMEYADVVAQKVYRDEAREVDRIMDEFLAISKNEKPYDVFICYKETDSLGERTIDSVLAQDIYDSLTAKGMKVFFARITLEDKLGQMYEPYIFAALNSAKVMLVVGTKYEYFHAVWVKNEWSRFLKLMAKDKSKVLIPCYKDMDAYDMPDEFKALQAQDMGKIGFMQDLTRGVEKIVGVKNTAVSSSVTAAPVQAQNNSVAPLLERAFMFLEDKEWENADLYFEKVLDIEPKNGQAYLGKLLIELEINNSNLLPEHNETLYEYKNYQKALKFGTEELRVFLEDCNESIQEKKLRKIYDEAKQFFDAKKYSLAKKLFESISFYSDAEAMTEKCDKAEIEHTYNRAQHAFNSKDYFTARDLFAKVIGYKDSEEMHEKCKIYAKEKRKEYLYNSCCKVFDNSVQKTKENYEEAVRGFQKLGDYKDSAERLEQCKNQLALIIEEEQKKAWIKEEKIWMEKERRQREEEERRQKDEEERRRKEDERQREEERKEMERRRSNRRAQGLCQYCGGTFKGLFTKKCSFCGKEKDY